MPKSAANGVAIHYQVDGAAESKPILLLNGVGQQMTRWTDSFAMRLTALGYRVVRMDNRDVGLSDRPADASLPDLGALIRAKAGGAALEVPYQLDDMAADAAALLADFGIEKAHVAGVSMGGMIAQLVAINHPDRVLSLTSIMSTTGNPALPRATPAAQAVLSGQRISPLSNREAYLDQSVENARILGSPAYPEDADTLRAASAFDLDRAFRPDGFLRQYAAILAAGDRRDRLAKLDLPALVIHGADDPLVPVEAGRDTAASVPGARLLEIPGMGHNIPRALEVKIAEAIDALASGA
ncbi:MULTISPECIES: alpha/beta fold hydrolase [Roseobacteraceae]|uniref:Aclacinomycin methylesterase RdmC n=1 Tax=Pseudosulfitobacter pseudonitzschiae TaxID=1402135 RepID=A0A221K7K1_9RHOB|nr:MULTISPECIES: alpha/beta hydrolase [Roseobacteraceae]ASM74988.1 aclacinomycin methylesterase RdmC [Pseudosulfitobacter pseudonitzschiae]